MAAKLSQPAAEMFKSLNGNADRTSLPPQRGYGYPHPLPLPTVMDDASIASFIQQTGASDSDARTFLGRTHGDLQFAIAMYYAESNTASNGASSSRAQPPPQKPVSDASWAKKHAAPRHRFATFSELAREEAESESRGASNDPQDLFAGGETSGLAVTPHQPGNTSWVEKILRQAQRRAQELASGRSNEPESPSAAPAQPPTVFSGPGSRLGVDSDEVASNSANSGPTFSFGNASSILSSLSNEDDEEPVKRTLHFWTNGFSIDDGPLYRFDDEENEGYLRSIHEGHAPTQLLNLRPGQLADVTIVRQQSEYVRPAATLNNSGPGQRLGASLSPRSASTEPAEATADSVAGSSTNLVADPAASSAAPPASTLGQTGNGAVQIRFADGSVNRARFDRNDLVQVLYDYVQLNRPTSRPFVLQFPRPPKPLQDRNETLESAGAIGAVVVQRWTDM